MAIQGLRDTTNFVTDQRPKNWRETILLLYPNGKAPLTALTSLMKTKATDDPEFNWWTKSLASQRLALSANVAAADTTLSVSSGALALKKGHTLRMENTGEVVLVTADPSTDTSINVSRAFGTTSAAAIAYASAGANPNLQVIGSAHKEGSDAPTGINYDPTKLTNYTQIFRNTLEITRTAQRTRLRTGDAVKEAKRECLEYHSIEMERAFILGEKKETTYEGNPIRTTGGIITNIDSGNIVDQAGATVSMLVLEGWLERMFRYGSSEKVAFLGNLAALTIQQAVRKNSHLNIQVGLKEFGMNVNRLTCPFGDLILKTHPLFNQVTGSTTGGTAYYGMTSWMLVVDTAELVYRPLDDTKYEASLQANGLDGMKSGYLTEAGLEIHHPTAHFLIKGLVEGKAD
jgi:hypothetical protein